jgi:hypothetical protein
VTGSDHLVLWRVEWIRVNVSSFSTGQKKALNENGLHSGNHSSIGVLSVGHISAAEPTSANNDKKWQPPVRFLIPQRATT